MAELTTKILTEIRDEQREFRAETRANFAQVEERLTSIERHMAAMLATAPVMNERIDRLEARVAALEGRSS